MELTFLFSLLLQGFAAWVVTQFFLSLLRHTRIWNPKKLPPGPFPLPIIGNLHSLGKMPHKSLTDIARRYGDLVSLQLGSVTTVVVSSPSLAQEVLREHDAVLAYRQIRQTTTLNDQHLHSVAFSPPGAKWRYLRKIATSNLFSNSRLDAGRDLRGKKVEELVSYLLDCSKTSTAVNISQAAFSTSLNILSNTFFSFDLADLRSGADAGHELKGLFSTTLHLAGSPNIADFFPMLGPIDPQGIRHGLKVAQQRTLEVLDDVIKERTRCRKENCNGGGGSSKEEDVLDVLITIHEENPEFELADMRFFLSDLFIAGTDTSSSTIEWTISELIRHPEKLRKVQAEVDQVIGRGNLIEDTDVAKLPYLRAVIKETLRLHPPAPFLIPRKSSAEVKLSTGHTIPKDALLWVNVWAMGRDEKVWKNAELFEPERFLNSPEIDYKGQNYDLLPFGSGRRVCLGIQLAHRVLHVVLGSLISCFDWKIPEGENEKIDVEERFGLTLVKAQPLCVIPVCRKSNI